ncbi:MAG: toll/interleukin-1 receptor domain-containing protein [Acidobacteriota bacterium]
MAFVPDYKHDIFVSYAHVDDLPFPGVEKGWVTTLVETLEILLAQKLGRKEAYSLWMDHQLSRHVDLTPEILDTLGQTATLLVILSPGYMASEWTLREKDTFLKVVGSKQRAGSRIFIVERDQVELGERPEQFADLLGYRFWVQEGEGSPPRILGAPWPDPKNPDNMSYFDQLTRLATNLADELKQLKEVEEPAEPATAADSEVEATQGTVFLAEVTDDLDAECDAMRRYLEQAGLAVLPDTWLARDPQDFQRQVDADLARSTLFVQLLSALPGRRPPGLPEGYVRTQYDRAVAAELPILQWRSRDLDPATVTDAAHRAFLECETVRAVGSEELKRTAVELATPKVEEPTATSPTDQVSTDALVFLNAEAGDLELAEAVGAALEERGVAYAMPLMQGSPTEVREDFEQNLMFCDALIILYGTVGAKWVRDQLLVLRKLAWKRDEPLRGLAILEGPPAPKDPVRLALPNLTTIEAHDGAIDDALDIFLAALEDDA